MVAFARICFILAVLTALCAVLARFLQLEPLTIILPATWLKGTGLLLLASVAACVLELAENACKK